jgi:hypothetical protein
MGPSQLLIDCYFILKILKAKVSKKLKFSLMLRREAPFYSCNLKGNRNHEWTRIDTNLGIAAATAPPKYLNSWLFVPAKL